MKFYGVKDNTDTPNFIKTETSDLSNDSSSGASITSSSYDFIPIRLRLATELAAQKAFENNEQKIMQQQTSREEKPAVLAFYLSGHSVGFASNLNNGLNGYLLARKTGVSFEFRVSSDWAYAPWKAMFLVEKDGVVKERDDVISCPEVPWDVKLISLEAMKSAKSGTEFCVCPFGNSNWVPFREMLGSLEANDTLRDCFQEKRRLAQAVWHLQPKYEDFIKRSLKLLIKSSEAFIAVHIRRGDKVPREMRTVDINEYVDVIIKVIAEQQYGNVVVFVFSDDDSIIPSFRENLLSRSHNNIRILTLRDFYDAQDNTIVEAQNRSGYDHYSFSRLGVTERMAQTRDFILSLSIARFSDTFIGTLSSNVARLISLLRYNSDLDSNISLDDNWTIY
jgi:hypothetical protein